MGAGDELMLSGEVRNADLDKPVIVYRRGQKYWHPVWENNKRFLPPDRWWDATSESHHEWRLKIAYAQRPYSLGGDRERWIWDPAYRAMPGDLFFTMAEQTAAWERLYRHIPAGLAPILIEPHIKPGASPNKSWGFDRYQAVVDRTPGRIWLQVGPASTRRLNGAIFLETATFRQAAALLALCGAYMGNEGGLHHAAAALAKPAVVIFGGYIHPQTTGYLFHRNLFTGGTACGWRIPCAHCTAAMAAITPDEVLEAMESALCGQPL